MPYQEVGGPKKDYPNDIWNFETGNLEARYVGKRENLGTNKNSTLYEFETEHGEKWKVWGSLVFDKKMAEVQLDDQVLITYLGTKGTNSYKDYSVQVWIDDAEGVARFLGENPDGKDS